MTQSVRFAQERQRLCTWLEAEKQKIAVLPDDARRSREAELEREFKNKIERLYGDNKPDPDSKKLN